jgi:hypothetical protein
MSYTTRTSGAELPSAKELMEILSKESPRLALRYDFLDIHASIFDAYKTLSALAHSDASWIELYKEKDLALLLDKINKNHQEIAAYIQANQNQFALYEKVYASLVPEQDDSVSETLFVFGAASNARIERAVELYKQGVSAKIIISGHRPHYGQETESEALRMAEFAQHAGIPASDLVLEDSAITIPDNVKRSIDLLLTLNWKPASITLIATDFVLSRAKMDWYKFAPWDVEIKVVAPRSQSVSFTKEGWYKDEKAVALVLNEYAKLILETKVDLIRKDITS